MTAGTWAGWLWRRGKALLFISVLLGLVVVACTPSGALVDEGRPVTDPAALDHTEWWLAEVESETAAGEELEPPIYLRFFAAGPDREENEFSGFAGCNYLGGLFALEEGAPLFPQIDRTRFPCDEVPPAVVEQEEAILAALEEANGLRLAADERLQVVDGDGNVRLVYTAKPVAEVDPVLTSDDWVLVSLNGEPPLTGVRTTLRFEANEEGEPGAIMGAAIGGNTGCNNYGGAIRRAAGGVFDVPEIVSNEEGCNEPEGMMAQELAFLEALRTAAAYRLEGDRLELLDGGGETTLTFEREP